MRFANHTDVHVILVLKTANYNSTFKLNHIKK